MSYFIHRKDVAPQEGAGHTSFSMLGGAQGCVAGFSSGISIYSATEYPTPGVHEDQEGFLVLEGTGWAKVGDEERRIGPEMGFVAPAGVPHAIKRDPDSAPVKVCWFHGAIGRE